MSTNKFVYCGKDVIAEESLAQAVPSCEVKEGLITIS